MPVTLSVKNVPDELIMRLRERSKRNHRSLQGELMAIIEEAVASRPLTIEEVRAQAKAMGLKSGSSVQMIREMRDGRYGG